MELGRRQAECTPAATDLGEAVLGRIERVAPVDRKRVELRCFHDESIPRLRPSAQRRLPLLAYGLSTFRAALPSVVRPRLMLDQAVRDDLLEAPVEREQRVTALELFFDLVFVFAITQVTGFLYHDPTWTRVAEAVAILMVLWFAWTAYAWLGNTAGSDEGTMRVVLLAAMAPLLVASLAVPHAFGKDALLFGVAYFLVRALHLVEYALLARGNPELGAAVVRLSRTILPAAGFLVLAGLLPEPLRAFCWAAALAIDYGGLLMSSTEGWRVEPAHFAERHGLIIIIALGESIVALGVGASGLALDAGVITAVVLGLAVAACLWWAYFDVVATVAERKLREAGPVERARIARDSYSYLHLPMVAGIVVFAFAVKETLGDVHAHLASVPAAALCGGVALYLLALSTFKRRNVGSFNYPRLVASATLVALAPAATALPALLSLALVAVIACMLITYEVFRFAEARARIRHAG
jgi:low temperature requirement protein LtrA